MHFKKDVVVFEDERVARIAKKLGLTVGQAGGLFYHWKEDSEASNRWPLTYARALQMQERHTVKRQSLYAY